MKILLDHGADVNARENYKGQTALMYAATYGKTPIVELLLESSELSRFVDVI